MTYEKQYLKRFMDNSAILSNMLCQLDLENYFDRKNKQAKHAYDKNCLVPIKIGRLTILLTEREAHCALLSIFGYTSKQIAKLMILSPRTVEHYIVCIKKKFYIQTRSELIITLLQSDFVHNMIDLINK